MKLSLKIISFISLLGPLSACGNNGGIFVSPAELAVDTPNNRLFVIENARSFSIFQASTFNKIGNQPFVNINTTQAPEVVIYNVLPTAPTNMKAVNMATSSRIFITGDQVVTGGTRVHNQILVLDFDGVNLIVSPISPIIVEDTNSTPQDILGGLCIDTVNSLLYVTDSTEGMLHTYHLSTGAEVLPPIAVAGTPNQMSLTDGHLFIANSTTVAANQVVTVVAEPSETVTTINLGIPTNGISVTDNGTGLVLMAQQAGVPNVLVDTVDTTTFASATAIPAGNTTVENGAVTLAAGLTDAADTIRVTKNSAGTVYGYVAQSNGDLALLTIVPQLTSFTADTFGTGNTDIYQDADTLQDGNGNDLNVYITAPGGSRVIETTVGSTSLSVR